MTEDSAPNGQSPYGYIYPTNWKKRQPKHKTGMAWIQLHRSLVHDDRWCSLSPTDRVILVTIWLLTSDTGYGRLEARLSRICRVADVPWSPRNNNLERLSQAGWIEIRAERAESQRRGEEKGSSNLREEENARTAPTNGRPPRSEDDPPHLGDTELAEHLERIANERDKLANQ